jgi:hypothetical protein
VLTLVVVARASNVCLPKPAPHLAWTAPQATVLLKNIQQKALERAKTARGPAAADATAGHGLHTE